MAEQRGLLRKMRVALDDPVRYHLRLDALEVALNPLLGQTITLRHTGVIRCVRCDRVTKKSFGDGFCYPCFRDAPETSPCIIRPELCEAHLGQGRDPAWEAAHHDQPHVVYLAVTSALKVGVTRLDQVPTRWIDQGAWRAVRLAQTPYRQLAGQIEVACKEHVSDKTPWQRMLKDERAEDIDPLAEKRRLLSLLPPELASLASPDDEVVEIRYPQPTPPQKVKSQSLDKVGVLSGELTGVRGQYLLLSGDRVFNVRRHSGYEVVLER